MAVSLLLVDDSEIVREITAGVLVDVFGDRQLEITEAGDGTQAVAALATKQFDVIILDLTMPKMDGYEFLKHLRSVGNTTKVIVMSADMQGGAIQRALDLGAYAFLPKPVLAAALTKALAACGVL